MINKNYKIKRNYNHIKRVETSASSGLSIAVCITFNASKALTNFSIEAII